MAIGVLVVDLPSGYVARGLSDALEATLSASMCASGWTSPSTSRAASL
jgi:hypothetical protein